MNPRGVFLLDGIGALLSAFLLGIVLVRFQELFGVPMNILIGLAILALGMAMFSLTCYYWFPAQWRMFLKAIAIINITYCMITVVLVVLEDEPLTVLGYLYFIGEVILIMSITTLELKVARS